jgi:hypothetical protein
MAEDCAHSNKSSRSTKGGKFLYQVMTMSFSRGSLIHGISCHVTPDAKFYSVM